VSVGADGVPAGGGPADAVPAGGGSADGVQADRAALVERVASAPGRIADAARRLAAEDEAAGGPPPGEWSAREVVGHLVAVEIKVWQARLDSLDAGGTPDWSWTEPGPATDPAARTLEGAIALLAASRSVTLARVTGLDEAGWARSGIHATFGRLDLAGLLAVAADHDDEHLAGLAARGG
jgi:hypothetical protein